MDLKLSWDLFVIVFFAIVTAYTFIIGRKDTLKIIIGSYIAILTVDGIGNIFQSVVGNSAFFDKLVKFIGYSGGAANFSSIFKIILFIGVIVILTIFGDYEVQDPPIGQAGFVNMIILIIMSFLSCGLLLSTIIIFANGGSLIGGVSAISDSFREVYEQSRLIRGLLDWHDIWFSLPGAIFVLISIFQKNS